MNEELTQTAKQTVYFFEEFIRRKEVETFIKKYRKHLNLPSEGLSCAEQEEQGIKQFILFLADCPKKLLDLLPVKEGNDPISIMQECASFLNKQKIDSYHIMYMLPLFLLLNKVIDTSLYLHGRDNDLLKIEHLPTSSLLPNSRSLLQPHEYAKFMSSKYPIVLYINPQVSQRQIQDFISKNWSFIEEYKDHTTHTTNLRKKSFLKQERNDYIYKNRSLPRCEIMRKVNKKFTNLETIEYGYIGKIISQEKKRRENK